MSALLDHRFAGASLWFWLLFHLIVAVLLFTDLVLLAGNRNESADSRARKAWAWTAVLAAVAFCFALFVSKQQGPGRATEFLTGYLVEGSLSIDNLFVFLLLFRSLGLSPAGQQRVLLWGVLGAIVMRALFIFAGIALLQRFHWVQYLFAAVLLFAGVRLLRPERQGDPQPGPLRWLQKRIQSDRDSNSNAGSTGTLHGTAFLLVVLAVEGTDVLFALDSIPAVLAITRDTFIVYTSNIFAILGLRSLYFATAGALEKLRLLHYGLAVILIFVAVKMIAAPWLALPAWASLAVIVAILAAFALASRLLPPAKPAESS